MLPLRHSGPLILNLVQVIIPILCLKRPNKISCAILCHCLFYVLTVKPNSINVCEENLYLPGINRQIACGLDGHIN